MDRPEQQLQQCRARIDALDEQLAQLFIQRIGIIREVAELKAAHWPNSCHIRPAREGQMHHAIARRFAGSGFPARMALAIWRQLIGGSTHVESPLNVSYLAAHTEHAFYAREYFGVQAGTAAASDAREALTQLQRGTSNILLLPRALNHAWWREAHTLADAGLFIFAILPVEAATLAPALALATVKPEPSGADISYFVMADGSIDTVEGYCTEHPGGRFLGAHPTPVSFTSGE